MLKANIHINWSEKDPYKLTLGAFICFSKIKAGCKMRIDFLDDYITGLLIYGDLEGVCNI